MVCNNSRFLASHALSLAAWLSPDINGARIYILLFLCGLKIGLNGLFGCNDFSRVIFSKRLLLFIILKENQGIK